jgi:hypothetical protein
MRYHLYNNFNNGDVFFSRPIIKMFLDSFSKENILYHHKCNKGILRDIPNIVECDIDEYCKQTEKIVVYGDDVYINTWYGQGNMEYFNIGGGTTLSTIYLICKYIKNFFNLIVDVNEDINMYPTINFNNLNLDSKNLYKNEKFKVLICNDDAISGQSHNTNLDFLIEFLSSTFRDIIFLVTKKNGLIRENILFTDDLYPNRPNLLEISFLSTHCNVILGRSSGPYSYSMIKSNISDNTKTLISLTKIPITGIWDFRFHNCDYSYKVESNINNITSFVHDKIYQKYIHFK